MSAPTADAIGTDSAQTFETLRTKSPAGGTLRTSHTSTVAPERVSGAQSVVRSLEELGVDVMRHRAEVLEIEPNPGSFHRREHVRQR